jgi:LDH2 family malate/lactate/ureidoglycolate dehydrogenase
MADYQRGEEFDALLSKIPAAFFKSVGYTAVASLLGGGLTGFTLPDGEEVRNRWSSAKLGGMVLAIHVDSVLPQATFYAETDRMVRDVRETYQPMPGTDQAILPGGIEEERMREHRRDGIRYGEMEQESAQSVSQRLGVPLPWD